MDAEQIFLGYASTSAQAANTSTSTDVAPGGGDYSVQKLADMKAIAPPRGSSQESNKAESTETARKR